MTTFADLPVGGKFRYLYGEMRPLYGGVWKKLSDLRIRRVTDGMDGICDPTERVTPVPEEPSE